MSKKATLHNKALQVLLAEAFKKCGIEYVRFDFSGSGDSGAIDGHEFHPDGGDKDDTVTTEREALVRDFKLEEMAEAALEKTGCDYCNNDGGQGRVIITPKYVQVHMEENVMTVNKLSFEFQLEEVQPS